MMILFNDIKYAFRQLRKSPGFTAVAVLTLGLGIGANVTMFGFVNTYLLRSLPFDDPERMVAVQRLDKQSGDFYCVHFANFLDWQEQNQTFEILACYHDDIAILNEPGMPEKLKVIHATADLLPMLGVQPFVGRFFEAEDDQPQAPWMAILSYSLWHRRFGAKTDVVDQSIEVDGFAATIIGVLPASFAFPPWSEYQGEIWLPIRPWIEIPKNRWFMGRGSGGSTYSIGRLKSGVTLDQARADMDVIARQLEEQYPDTNRDRGVYLAPFQDHMVRKFKPAILLLMGAVTFVLLIVCANLANLMLIRSTASIKEFSVRCALGAGRWSIVRQIMCESGVLVTLGGAMGILFAVWGGGMLSAILPVHLQVRGMSLTILNGHSLLFIIGLMVVTVLLCSLVSVLRMSRIDFKNVIRAQLRTATTDIRGNRLRDTIVVGEIVLALILLVGAGLMLNSFIHYVQTDPGYNTEGVVTLRMSLPREANRRDQLCERILQQVNALTGVKHAGMSSSLLRNYNWRSGYAVEGIPDPEPDHQSLAQIHEVTPGFFRAMGMRLLQGRLFNEQDMTKTSNSVIVDEAFVQKWWPQDNPIGQHIRFRDTMFEVVGIVSHVKHEGADKESLESLYYCGYRKFEDYRIIGVCRDIKYNDIRDLSKPIVFKPDPGFCGSYKVRTQVNPQSLIPAVRKTLAAIDPAIPLENIKTQSIQLDESVVRERCFASLTMAMALLAVLLSCIGLYGVMAYNVERRTSEIGIRVALGATTRNVAYPILRSALLMATAGIAVAIPVVFAVVRIVRSYLFGIEPNDPLTLAGAIILLLAVAFLAAWIPARRAAKVDPMEALRYE